jgi:hypothetical protein
MNVFASTGDDERIYVALKPDLVEGDSVTESSRTPIAFEQVSGF